MSYTAADTMVVEVRHQAMGTARVARNRVRLNNSGDSLNIELYTRFGLRAGSRFGERGVLEEIGDRSLRIEGVDELTPFYLSALMVSGIISSVPG